MQIFRPGANSIAVIFLVSLGALPVVAMGVATRLARSPYVTGQDVTRDQPIPFSHAHHVGGLGLDCRYCHASVERARFAGMPDTETCMACHSQIWTNAGMLAPVRESLARNTPIAWQRVHRLPDYVYFDHAVHVAKGVGCSTCHGPVEQMKLTRQSAPLTMQWCLDCHRSPAKNLRPPDRIFDQSWTSSAADDGGTALMAYYHIRLAHLTDCTTCHR